jgi:hypothetical protein
MLEHSTFNRLCVLPGSDSDAQALLGNGGPRLLLRFEHLQQRHFGMKLLAYTLINVREFCDA